MSEGQPLSPEVAEIQELQPPLLEFSNKTEKKKKKTVIMTSQPSHVTSESRYLGFNDYKTEGRRMVGIFSLISARFRVTLGVSVRDFSESFN